MLKKANIQWSAKQLSKKIANGDIVFDCAVQRGYVWDHDRKSLLIHSLIEGYPVPAFFFAKNDDGEWIALDGKQRCNAISAYMSGEYALSDNTPCVYDENGDEVEISGIFFDNLPEWAQDEIKDYSLTIYYFEGITDEEISELFYRINNGKPLTALDLTRVRAKSLKQFQQIAAHDAIMRAVTEKGLNGNVHENIAMQAWAVCFTESPDLETKHFRPLIEEAEVTDSQVNELISALDYVLPLYNSLDPDNKEEKRILRKVKTRTHLVSCIYLAKICINNGITQKEFADLVCNFFNTTKTTTNESYNSAVGAGSARPENVQKRLNALRELVRVDERDEDEANDEKEAV